MAFKFARWSRYDWGNPASPAGPSEVGIGRTSEGEVGGDPPLLKRLEFGGDVDRRSSSGLRLRLRFDSRPSGSPPESLRARSGLNGLVGTMGGGGDRSLRLRSVGLRESLSLAPTMESMEKPSDLVDFLLAALATDDGRMDMVSAARVILQENHN